MTPQSAGPGVPPRDAAPGRRWAAVYAQRLGQPVPTPAPDRDSPSRRAGPIIALAGLALALLLLVGWIALAGGHGAPRVDEPEIESPAFDPAFESAMKRFGELGAEQMIPPGAALDFMGPWRAGARIPLDPRASLELAVCYDPQAPAGAPIMQLQVSKVTRRDRYTSDSTLGYPRVLCDLDQAQAQEVMLHGVPEALRYAMLRETGAVDWNGWSASLPSRPDIRVDPSPFFGGGAK